MIPQYNITIREVYCGRKYRATISDVLGNETLIDPCPGDSWGIATDTMSLERRTFAKAAKAASETLAEQIAWQVLRSLGAAKADATKVVVTTGKK